MEKLPQITVEQLDILERKKGKFVLRMRLEASCTEGAKALQRLGFRMRKPIEAWGALSERGAWLWFEIPVARDVPWSKLRFGNTKD